MRFFDLHCDTLYRAVTENKTLFEPTFQLSLDRSEAFTRWIQCMAVWIPDEISPDEGFQFFKKASLKLKNELQKSKINNITDKASLLSLRTPSVILTVENGALIGNDLERINTLADSGVKILTLTWNGNNSIGCGSETTADCGITEFGKAAVALLEEKGIIIDVSHAGDKLFYDVADLARKPFIATHSNSRVCTPHKRNLTDNQFSVIKSSGGIVGINFCDMFLNKDKEKACIDDIIRHTEHFLSLGGEDTICIGSDFDGCDVIPDIAGIEGISKLYNAFLRLNYNEHLIDKIFFSNAYDFFVNHFDICSDIL